MHRIASCLIHKIYLGKEDYSCSVQKIYLGKEDYFLVKNN